MRAGAKPGITGGGVGVGIGIGVVIGLSILTARAAFEKLNANSKSPNFFVVFIINILFVMVVRLLCRIKRVDCVVTHTVLSTAGYLLIKE
ncbi:MAG: hypothetical protein WCP01_15170 [Methylococcaceae bacterium]